MALRQVDNPPNPYLSEHRQWLGPPPEVRVEVYEETAVTIITENDSPDIPFRWSINPYRGCQHACAYCYARPYHEYLGFGAGTDFDTRLVVKINAAELLRRALAKPKWRGRSFAFSGITDPYQPIEASYGVTRGCLEACVEFGNAASVITKNILVVRDAELLAALHRRAEARVYLSIPFADDETARAIEPYAPPPSRRFEAIRRLVEAGLPVGVMVAPIIPGLNDRDIPRILERAAQCGARSAGHIALRLARSVAPVFLSRLRAALPQKAARIESRIREMRGGGLNETRFGRRMSGEGEYWRSVKAMFDLTAGRLGLESARRDEAPALPTPADRTIELQQLSFDFS